MLSCKPCKPCFRDDLSHEASSSGVLLNLNNMVAKNVFILCFQSGAYYYITLAIMLIHFDSSSVMHI